MRIGFYNPYLDGFGGGERYTLALASHWSQKHDTEVFWHTSSVLNEAEKRFGLDLSRLKVAQNIFRGKNLFKKLYLSRKYDLIFFLSDGSIPSSFAKHNILHFQVPFAHVEANPFKLSRFNAIVCNSSFTKNHLDLRLGQRASVIYPPVATGDLKPGRKKKQILSVGRFSGFFQSKKQQVLIAAFRKGVRAGRFSGWRLLLVGGLLPSDHDFFRSLGEAARGLPIELHPNTGRKQLTRLYAQSPIYWHAAGFDETDPMRMEHFGISTVEAMAAGCVPVVYKGGGQSEIVENKKNGFLWTTVDELIDYTVALESKNSLHTSMQRQAQLRAKEFDETKFTQAFDTLLK